MIIFGVYFIILAVLLNLAALSPVLLAIMLIFGAGIISATLTIVGWLWWSTREGVDD